MSSEIFGTHEEMEELVDTVRKAVERGLKGVTIEQARMLKGYGVFAEIVNGELTFGIRIRTVGGRVTTDQLRLVGELAKRLGRNLVDITNRQGFQIHYLGIDGLKEVLYGILDAGLTSKGGCGDTPRAITTCPVSDVDKEQLFDVMPVIRRVNEHYYRKWEIFGPSAIPRKFKVSITACPYRCSFPEINCVGLIGVIKDGKRGFTATVGGGLSTAPHIGKHMPVFLDEEDVLAFLEAVVEIWKSDPRYRPRHRARIKFLVDDYGIAKLRRLVEHRLGKKLEDFYSLPKPRGFDDHMGIHEQKDGRYYIGVPTTAGSVTGDMLISLADAVEELTEGGDVRITPQQNLIVTNVPETAVKEVEERLSDLGFPIRSKWAGRIICDVASPFCVYSTVRTKRMGAELVRRLDSLTDGVDAKVRVHITGCPRDCGQHWIGDIGLIGKVRDGREVYDITFGGGHMRIGRVVKEDVPADKVAEHVENILRTYLKLRSGEGEDFAEFCDKYSLDQLARFTEIGPQ